MNLSIMQNSEDMHGVDIKFTRKPIQDPYALGVTCGKGTLYEETCKFTDCRQNNYQASAEYGCESCQSKAEESDAGI